MQKESFSFCVLADPHCAEKAFWMADVYENHINRFFACVAEIEKLKGENELAQKETVKIIFANIPPHPEGKNQGIIHN